MPKQQNPYEIKALHDGHAEIYIYGDIGDNYWDDESTSAVSFVRELSGLTANEITVRINSYGGSVSDGVAIYNALKRHDATINVVIDGIAMSIASLIAMAGSTVDMAENAILMIHAPLDYQGGNAAKHRELAEKLDKYADAMLTSYANKTGQSKETIDALLKDGKDHYFTAEEALEMGFIDSISDAVQIAASGIPLDRYSLPATWVAANKPKGNIMPKAQKPAAQEPVATPQASEPNNVAAAVAAPTAAPTKADVLAAEKERRTNIRAAFTPFKEVDGMAAIMDACLDDHNINAEEANQKILAKLGEKSEPLAGSGNIKMGETGSERFIADASQSILVRAGVEKRSSNDPFRGMTLLDVARASLDRIGVQSHGMDKREIVSAAFTQGTSDFPVLLENVMHKTLLNAYRTAPDTWRRFCAVGEVSDFRTHNRYRTGSFGNLDALNELGEFKNKTIPDGEKEGITASTKGNVINISRQAIINDDLSAFNGLAATLGRAAPRTIESDVYALLAANPTMSDGVALFHSDHGNLAGSGAAIGVTTLEAARVAMASQQDVSGNDYLDIRPDALLCGMAAGGGARVTVNSQYDPDAASKLQRPNIVNGLVSDIIDTPRISGTEWYLLANAMEAPAIEVAFLDGIDEPFLDVQEGWGVDGAQYKVRLDYGVAAIDYRGIYKNAGS